jgi:hypothetical protein
VGAPAHDRPSGSAQAVEALAQRVTAEVGEPDAFVCNLGWYETLALCKSAISMEGNYGRALRGTTDDPYLHRSGAAVVELASRAEARLASR